VNFDFEPEVKLHCDSPRGKGEDARLKPAATSAGAAQWPVIAVADARTCVES
jgi:hypothetical protein